MCYAFSIISDHYYSRISGRQAAPPDTPDMVVVTSRGSLRAAERSTSEGRRARSEYRDSDTQTYGGKQDMI